LIIKGFVIATPGKLRKKIGSLEATMNSIHFDNTFMGSRQTQIIKIHNAQEDTLYISTAKIPDGFEVEINPSVLNPAGYGELIIHFNSQNMEFGKNSDIILFDIDQSDKKQKGKVYIISNVIEDFSVLTQQELTNSPKISVQHKTLNLSNLNPGELHTEVIEIENIGTRELYIRNIQVSDKRFSVTPAKFIVNPGEIGSFNVSVTPNDTINRLKTIVTLISNDPVQSITKITIIAEVNLAEGYSTNTLINDVQIEKAAKIIQNYDGKDNFAIIDVRTKEEYDAGYIKSALNIDYNSSDFEKMLSILNKQKTYLIYCHSGVRSKKAANLMKKKGFGEIYHMYEGIEGWKERQLKLSYPDK